MPAPAVAAVAAAGIGSLVATIAADVAPLRKGITQATKSVKTFGSDVVGTMKGAKQHTQEFISAFGPISDSFNSAVGAGSVFGDIMTTVKDIFGSFIDIILGGMSEAWVPFLQILADIAVSVGEDLGPFLKDLAEIVRDTLIPVFKEYRPEIEFMFEIFGKIIAIGVATFLIGVAAAIVGIGEAIRTNRENFDYLLQFLEKLPGGGPGPSGQEFKPFGDWGPSIGL